MSKVGCAGILVEDTICPPMDKFLDEGQLLAVDEIVSKPGGCAGNVAIGLVKQGLQVDINACVGNDPTGASLVQSVENQGVNCAQIQRTTDFPTSRTVIILIKNEDRRFIHTFGANRAYTVDHIDREWVRSLKVLYVGGLFAMPAVEIGPLAELLAFARASGVITMVDVVVPGDFSQGDRLKELLPHIDYFTPNDDESEIMTGEKTPEKQIQRFLDVGANTVILTCGEQGVYAARGQDLWQGGIFKTDVIDPSGSGDAFDTGVIKGILDGKNLPDLLHYGAAVASSCVRAVGTTDGVFTADELEAFLQENKLNIDHRTF